MTANSSFGFYDIGCKSLCTGNPLFSWPATAATPQSPPVNFHIRPAGCPPRQHLETGQWCEISTAVTGCWDTIKQHDQPWYHIKTNAPTLSTSRTCLFFSRQVKLETEWNASTCGGFHHWRYPFIAAWFIFWKILRWMMTGGTLWLRKAPHHNRTRVCGICGTFGLNTKIANPRRRINETTSKKRHEVNQIVPIVANYNHLYVLLPIFIVSTISTYMTNYMTIIGILI